MTTRDMAIHNIPYLLAFTVLVLYAPGSWKMMAILPAFAFVWPGEPKEKEIEP